MERCSCIFLVLREKDILQWLKRVDNEMVLIIITNDDMKKNMTIQTNQLLDKLRDEEQGKMLLEEIAGHHQFVSLDIDDIRFILSCGNYATLCEGYGNQCEDAISEALNSLQSLHKDITQAKGILLIVSIQNRNNNMMEAVEALNNFFGSFAIIPKYKWGMSSDEVQPQSYKVTILSVN